METSAGSDAPAVEVWRLQVLDKSTAVFAGLFAAFFVFLLTRPVLLQSPIFFTGAVLRLL